MTNREKTRAELESDLDALERERDDLRAKLAYCEATQIRLIKTYAAAMPQQSQQSHADEATSNDPLSKLTLKQHAVLVAIAAGKKYAEIAEILGVDQTTVKLHLKAVQEHLGVEGRRDVLLMRWGQALGEIPSEEYEKKYGVAKDWYIKKPATLMSQLARARPSAFPAKKTNK